MPSPTFEYHDPFQIEKKLVFPLRLLSSDFVSTAYFEGREILTVAPEGLTLLARTAMRDVSFLLRGGHLQQVAAILDDPEASKNDCGVALAMLKNAEVAAKGILPFCQDTGTAIVFGKKGHLVWTDGRDAETLSLGIHQAYTGENLRYSQTVPLTMEDEINSGNNLPAQIDIYASEGGEFEFLFQAKGGGSANKTFLFQETRALLNTASLEKFFREKIRLLGTAACPPYHLVFVVGGTSAEACLKTVKLASAKWLDGLPDHGNEWGQAFRDKVWEEKVLKMACECGIGAQFGGKYFALDVRVIRLPRHGASCPVGVGVSCSADRNIFAKINREGIWLEELESNPGRFIPEKYRTESGGGIEVNLDRPMTEVLSELSRYTITTQLSLTGTLIVARDMAHAKWKERLDRGDGLPDYLMQHPVYYAGPAKRPEGMASGSFGPTTAGRMDSYVTELQSHGASLVMIAKGNRSKQVTEACQKYGGFYLGSIGGPAAILARDHIKKVECLEYPELGMEAVWKIEVEKFPAFILVDDKGNDFFSSCIR